MELLEVIDRDITLDLDADKIIVIAGVRIPAKSILFFRKILSS
jgi:hypothetical protein